MVQLGKGGEHVGIARLAHAHAEVHIVEGHGKALVQTVHFLVHALAHHQAGSGDGIDVLRIDQTAHIAGVPHREILVHVGCQRQEAEADAGVLDGIVRVEQLCAHAAHAVLLGVHEHFLDPARGNDLGIVVEQQQVFAGGFLCTEVVQSTVIEAGALPCDDPQVPVLLLQLFVAAEGSFFLAVVLDDDDLKVLIGGLVIDGFHTGAQVPGVIAAGDQDADPARLCKGVIRLVKARRARDHGYTVHRDADPLVVSIQCLDCCFQAVGLGRDIAGHAGGAGTPVVQQMRDMHDLVCLFGQAQVKIIVLTAVELRPLVTAHFCQQLCAEHAQVADVVVGTQVVDHVIRLEVVDRQMVDVALKGHLVGIHKVCPLLCDGPCHIPQSTGMQDIVVVQQSDVLALSKGKALIGVARNALVLFQFLVADTGVGSRAGLDRLADCLILSGVHKAQFPVLVRLVLHRIQQLHKELLGGVVQRHHDADERCVRLVSHLPYQQLSAGEPVGAQNIARKQLCIFFFGLCLRPHPGDAHPAQLRQKDERREGMDNAAAFADHIAQRPGRLPERRVDHAVQGLFQFLLVAAAQGKVAVQAGQLSSLLFAGALGQQHPFAQLVQHHLVPGRSLLCIQRFAAAAEPCRLQGAHPALPLKIAGKALLRQLTCAIGHDRSILTDQKHLTAFQLRQLGPLRVHDHQQTVRICLPGQAGAGLFQRLFQQTAAAQHLYPGRGQLPHDALCQLPAALRLKSCFLFLFHSAFSTPTGFLSFKQDFSHKIANTL